MTAATLLASCGEPQNVSRYAGYELHFCSADCKKQFDADPDAATSKLPG